jgi:hypothetical protein
MELSGIDFSRAQMHIFRYNRVAIGNIHGPLASITTFPSQQISLWSYSLDVVVELILHSVGRACSYSIHPCHLLYHSLVGNSSLSCAKQNLKAVTTKRSHQNMLSPSTTINLISTARSEPTSRQDCHTHQRRHVFTWLA